MVEVLADGTVKRAPKPGTALATQSKKTGFGLLSDYWSYHSHTEPIYEILEEADSISSTEQLTMYDLLAAAMQCLIGNESIYPDIISEKMEDEGKVEKLGATPIYY
jgi:hypothetical protein